MFRLFNYILSIFIFSLTVSPVFVKAESLRDSVETINYSIQTADNETKDNALTRLIKYFDSSNKKEITSRPDFSVLGGPHYSSEKGFGLGLVVAGLYSTQPTNSLLPISNISLVGNIATKKFYMVGVEGVHVFPKNTKRINYDLSFESFATYFWGIGYEMGNNNSNKTKYDLLKLDFVADMEWRLAEGFYIGPAIRFVHSNAKNIRNDRTWAGLDHASTSTAAGLRLQYDLRDNFTAPKRGLLLEVTQLFYPEFLGNSSNAFSSTEAGFSMYVPVWRDGIVAGRIHGLFTYGSTPWDMMAYIGGKNMRGYYEGRYRDKNEIDLTLELRQHVWRRSGIVVWSGVATVFPRFGEIRFKHFLPDFGFGYRWEFKKNSNVRIDIGFGKHSTGFMFGLNEAF